MGHLLRILRRVYDYRNEKSTCFLHADPYASVRDAVPSRIALSSVWVAQRGQVFAEAHIAEAVVVKVAVTAVLP